MSSRCGSVTSPVTTHMYLDSDLKTEDRALKNHADQQMHRCAIARRIAYSSSCKGCNYRSIADDANRTFLNIQVSFWPEIIGANP